MAKQKTNKQLMKEHQAQAEKFQKKYEAELEKAALKFGKAFLKSFDDESDEYDFVLANAKELGKITFKNIGNLKKTIEQEKVEKSLEAIKKTSEKSLDEVKKDTESGLKGTEKPAESISKPPQTPQSNPSAPQQKSQISTQGISTGGTNYQQRKF